MMNCHFSRCYIQGIKESTRNHSSHTKQLPRTSYSSSPLPLIYLVFQGQATYHLLPKHQEQTKSISVNEFMVTMYQQCIILYLDEKLVVLLMDLN